MVVIIAYDGEQFNKKQEIPCRFFGRGDCWVLCIVRSYTVSGQFENFPFSDFNFYDFVGCFCCVFVVLGLVISVNGILHLCEIAAVVGDYRAVYTFTFLAASSASS